MPDRNPSEYVKAVAADAGFDRCGIARAEPFERAQYLKAWLACGFHGSMHYLRQHFNVRTDPTELLPDARSVVVVALLYHRPKPSPVPGGDAGPRGRVAMYAWGDDYHEVVKAKLRQMVDRIRTEFSEPFEARVCVDTAPLLERELAAAAGIGWIGRNTMVIHNRLGSFFVLGELVTTLDLVPDAPVPNRCGTCTACLDACPTGALRAPYEMDASRCISYLTIEHRGDIAESLQSKMGNWITGCDVCQEVCPHNRHAPMTREPRFAIRPPGPEPLLDELLGWTAYDYRKHLRGSAMKRATLAMLQRNASIARANTERGVADP